MCPRFDLPTPRRLSGSRRRHVRLYFASTSRLTRISSIGARPVVSYSTSPSPSRVPGNLFQNFFYFRTQPLQLVIVAPENLDCDVRTNAFEHFVKAHLNRLRYHQHPGLSCSISGEMIFARSSLLIVRSFYLSPFLLRFIIEVKVAIAWRYWISCDLCAADP